MYLSTKLEVSIFKMRSRRRQQKENDADNTDNNNNNNGWQFLIASVQFVCEKNEPSPDCLALRSNSDGKYIAKFGVTLLSRVMTSFLFAATQTDSTCKNATSCYDWLPQSPCGIFELYGTLSANWLTSVLLDGKRNKSFQSFHYPNSVAFGN